MFQAKLCILKIAINSLRERLCHLFKLIGHHVASGQFTVDIRQEVILIVFVVVMNPFRVESDPNVPGRASPDVLLVQT